MLRHLLVMVMVFQMVNGGAVRKLDACSQCKTEEEGVLRCSLGGGEALAGLTVSLRGCPGSSLWTDETIMVMAIEGKAASVYLAKTTLGCHDLPIPAIINNLKCNRQSLDDTQTAATSTTTTTKKYRWIPFPVPVAGNEVNVNTSTTSMPSSTTSTESTSTMGPTVETTTVLLAISTAIRINETVVIITVAVTLAAIGTFCSIRCVRRRTRQQRPVQVPAVSSTSEEAAADPPVSPRRRRLYQGSSFESIELFNVAKED